MSHDADALLTVRNLAVSFDGRDGPVHAVRGVDLSVRRGEVVCLVGESGSGKSVTGFSLMGLIDPPGRVSATSCASMAATCCAPRNASVTRCGAGTSPWCSRSR